MAPAILDSVALPSPGPIRLAADDSPQRAERLDRKPRCETSADDLAVLRRQLRIRLLRDLVSNGLYRVPTEALAERLVSIVARRS